MKPLANLLPFPVPQPTPEQLAVFEQERCVQRARERYDRVERRISRLRELGAPRRVLDTLPDPSRDTEPMREIAHIGHARIIVLAGGVGIGKTTAALSWLVDADERLWYATARRWASSAPWHRDWERARVAVLDDLGTEDRDHRFAGRFDELVAHYHGQCHGLVITTNLTGAAFKDRYGTRVVSRIRELRGFIPVHGPDLRAQETE